MRLPSVVVLLSLALVAPALAAAPVPAVPPADGTLRGALLAAGPEGAGAVADAAAARLAGCGAGLAGAACVLEATLAFQGAPLLPRAPPAPHADAATELARLHAAAGAPLADGEAARAVAALPPRAAAALAGVAAATRVALTEAEAAAPGADRATPWLRDYMVASTLRASGQPLPRGADAVLATGDAFLAGVDAPRILLAARDLLTTLDVLGPLVCEDADGSTRVDLPLVKVGGTGADVYAADTVLQIDCGGDDLYLNNAGGSAPVGASVSLDYGRGSDTYDTTRRGQGYGLAGVGVLYDERGDELYRSPSFARGFGVAGAGVLVDDAGDDRYLASVPNTLGTLAGGLAGVGIILEGGGDDRYYQPGLDGFVYGAAGGAGVMVEKGGDDSYEAPAEDISLLGTFLGNFSGPILVSSEVTALAFLLEEGGADVYLCDGFVRQPCQSGAGIGAVAVLYESGGNDRYVLGPELTGPLLGLLDVFPTGQAAAYGPSAPPGPGVAVLRDLAGDDVYAAVELAQAWSTMGLAVLLDDAGRDAYALPGRADGATWTGGLGGVGVDRA